MFAKNNRHTRKLIVSASSQQSGRGGRGRVERDGRGGREQRKREEQASRSLRCTRWMSLQLRTDRVERTRCTLGRRNWRGWRGRAKPRIGRRHALRLARGRCLSCLPLRRFCLTFSSSMSFEPLIVKNKHASPCSVCRIRQRRHSRLTRRARTLLRPPATMTKRLLPASRCQMQPTPCGIRRSCCGPSRPSPARGVGGGSAPIDCVAVSCPGRLLGDVVVGRLGCCGPCMEVLSS